MGKSIIYNKSFGFAIKIVETYKFLNSEKHEFVMSKQLLKCGTSIGANVSEAAKGQSDKDFVSKMSIALKEANECLFWIDLLSATDFLPKERVNELSEDCNEILKILSSIILTMKKKISVKELRVKSLELSVIEQFDSAH